MGVLITEDLLDETEPGDTAIELRDTKVSGFLCRIQPTGLRTFYFEYRTDSGARRRMKLGRYPEASVTRAREKAKKYSAETTLGGDPAQEKKQARQVLTLAAFIDEWYAPFAESNLSSHKSVLQRIRYGFQPLLKTKLSELNEELFDKHREWRRNRKLPGARGLPSDATINRDFATLRAALSKAVGWKLIPVNPLLGYKLAKEDANQSIRTITDDEEKQLFAMFKARRDKMIKQIDAANEEREHPFPYPPRFLSHIEPIILIALGTGMRRREILQATWADVDWTNNVIVVRGKGAKNKQSRELPLTPRTRQALTDWQAQTGSKSGFIFTKYDGGRFVDIKSGWYDALTEAKITGLRFHDLRHSYASRLVKNGVDIATVKSLCGHSSITTTMRYVHADPTRFQSAIKGLE